MQNLPTIDGVYIQGKTVLVRADLNVPMKEGKILDSSRIERLLPTLEELLQKGAKVVVLSHFGRPDGKVVPQLTLRPLAEALARALNQHVFFAGDSIGEYAHATVSSLKAGEICLLENLRFDPRECLEAELRVRVWLSFE